MRERERELAFMKLEKLLHKAIGILEFSLNLEEKGGCMSHNALHLRQVFIG